MSIFFCYSNMNNICKVISYKLLPLMATDSFRDFSFYVKYFLSQFNGSSYTIFYHFPFDMCPKFRLFSHLFFFDYIIISFRFVCFFLQSTFFFIFSLFCSSIYNCYPSQDKTRVMLFIHHQFT